MGLFDFLKPKKTELSDSIAHMRNSSFPKGEKDINAATDELLYILSNKISREEAKSIILKSIAISNIAANFDKERLKAHLKGYCLQHFNESELSRFYDYIMACKIGMVMNRSTPSEIKRAGEGYGW